MINTLKGVECIKNYNWIIIVCGTESTRKYLFYRFPIHLIYALPFFVIFNVKFTEYKQRKTSINKIKVNKLLKLQL